MARTFLLTGGPSSGKTQVSSVLQEEFKNQIHVFPEVAAMLYGSGFPRGICTQSIINQQMAIFHTQRALESNAQLLYPDSHYIFDRGHLDGATYWPTGIQDFLDQFALDLIDELKNYSCIIQLGVARGAEFNKSGEDFRIEDELESLENEQKLIKLYSQHSNYHFIPFSPEIIEKSRKVASLIRKELQVVLPR